MSANTQKTTAIPMKSGSRGRGKNLELDERKRTILHAIVRNYLETGEPVGSRTISKDTDLD